VKFYILCKNESANIRKCIESLLSCGYDVAVLDSGSVDGTQAIVQQYPVELVIYQYTTHCNAYNEITTSSQGGYCGILDADMEMTRLLAGEISTANKIDVLIAPIEMYVDGIRLEKGNLCPPKPIVFKTGKAYFESVGHGERLIPGLKTVIAKAMLPHNDLKPYLSYLGTQVRYADNFIVRSKDNQLTWRDRLRLKSPLLILITPIYSLLVKGGIFKKAGWLYALDRLIAEAIMFRSSISERIKQEK
jgi:glycosyltransferase involved in cell wall biosynthesis